MVMTPWGEAGTLRDGQLPPGRGKSREEVRQSQRERLFGAMVALCADRGYAATSVGDLVEVSGVSSRSFYVHFDDKEACFLATMEEILRGVQRVTAAKLGGTGSADERIGRAGAALAEALVGQPAAARLWLVESFCAGEQSRQRIRGALWAFSKLMEAALEQTPDRKGMPPPLTRAILGGIAGVGYRRLARGESDEFAELVVPLRRWTLTILPPPGPLRTRQRRRRAVDIGSPPFAAHVLGERILRGLAMVIAEKGFAATTIADIAAAASISQSTFYRQFRDKDDALMAALDSSGAQMLAAVMPAIRRSDGWPNAMRVAVETCFAFLAAEPAFAHLREVEVYAVGPSAVEVRDRTGEEVIEVLGALAQGQMPPVDPLTVEATLAAVHSLVYEWIRDEGAESLMSLAPMATYLILAPMVGAEAAWQVASD